jgi:PAS domain S-box-containing protein
MFDRDMRYLAASQRWKDDYGLGDQDLVGLNHYALFPDLPEHLTAAHRRGLAGETLRVEEDCIEWTDGRVQWVRWEQLPWRQQDGAIGGLLISAEDITERRHVLDNLKESEQRFRSLFEHLPIAYQSLDIEGRWLDANQKTADLLGFASPEAMLGKEFIDYWDDSLKDPFDCNYKEFKQTHAIEGELPLHRTDGRPITVQIAGRIQRDAAGQFQRTHCILVDMTERRAMEEQILALNADLEQKVEQRTQQLAAANAAKSQFLASMSHEIRTPMNAVLGLAQLLEDEPLTEDQQQMVTRINTAGRSLLSIINDILDFSKIEAGQLSVEQRPFQLTELLSHIDHLLGPVAQGKGLTLHLRDDASLRGRLSGDALRIEQVLINLIGNALKFTEQGGVTLRVKPVSANESAARLRFEIQDRR